MAHKVIFLLNDSYYGDNLSEKLIDWRKKWFMDYLIYDVFLLEWDPSSLISFILSLIWLELGFNQITALIIRAKQMLPRRRARLIDENFEKLNKSRMFFWHFSFCLTLCLLSRSADREKGTVCMINKSEAITKVYVVFTSLHWQTLYLAPPAPVFQAEKRFNMLLP